MLLKDLNCLTWSSYHASESELDLHAKPQAISQLLPLFYEKAATAAIIKNGMNVQHNAIQFLNPNQIPVIAFDTLLMP